MLPYVPVVSFIRSYIIYKLIYVENGCERTAIINESNAIKHLEYKSDCKDKLLHPMPLR